MSTRRAPRPRSQIASVRSQLSQRDHAILGDVGRVRLLRSTQIQRLHFDGVGSELTAARRCRKVLRRLAEHGLLRRLKRRIGGMHAGSSGFIYSLDSLGQRLLDTTGPAGGRRRRRPWEPSASFQDHVLAVAETYVQLRETERAGQGALTVFDAEPRAWRTFAGSGGGSTVLKPDAYVRWRHLDYEQVSFLEIDRDTEHAPTLRRKLDAYVDAFHAGVEQPDDQPFPLVIWIAPHDVRRQVIQAQIDRLPADQAELFTAVVEGVGAKNNIIKGGES